MVDSLQAATELVERRAPLAPTDSQNRAVTLICGYWFESPRAAAQTVRFRRLGLHSGAGAQVKSGRGLSVGRKRV